MEDLKLEHLFASLPDWFAKRMRQAEFLREPKFLLAKYDRRWSRRITLHLTDVEPRTKQRMPDSDKDRFQSKVLEGLRAQRRRAYRGPLALRINLNTTERTPAFSHQIAKNLLDLLSRPRESVSTGRRGLLYFDDSQVQVLSVSCEHGSSEPRIGITATSLREFFSDLDLARNAGEDHFNDDEDGTESALDDFKYVVNNEVQLRRTHGDEFYESWRRISYRLAQERFISKVATSPTELASLYNVGEEAFRNEATTWERLVSSTPLRIQLSELPQTSGSSKVWKAEIDEKLRLFRDRYGWIIDPIVVPVALEVLIKPPPISRTRGKHDLDNIVRTYLLPRVMEILRPLSHHAFTHDWNVFMEKSSAFAGNYPVPLPPQSTKIGVSRYELWRLPPAEEGSLGFVSVAIVSDPVGYEDTLNQIDDDIERWRDSLD